MCKQSNGIFVVSTFDALEWLVTRISSVARICQRQLGFLVDVSVREFKRYPVWTFLRTCNFYVRHYTYMYAIVRIWYGNSVYLLVGMFVCLLHAWILSKRLNISSKFFHYLIGPWFYSFRHQGLLRKSDGIIPNGGTEYNGDIAIFTQYAAMTKFIRHNRQKYRNMQ